MTRTKHWMTRLGAFAFALALLFGVVCVGSARAQEHPAAPQGKGRPVTGPLGRAKPGPTPPPTTERPPTESPTPVGGGNTEHAGHVENAGQDTHPDEHAGEHAGGHHAPEAINWTDIWDSKRPAIIALVINFGVLMTLYYMLGKKPVANALKQRRVTIGKEIDEAQKMLDEAKERAKKYQANLKAADADAATAKASLVASAKGEVERLLTEANEKAERMKRDADRLVEQERSAVHSAILNETIELAGAEATAILQKSVTADDHARLAQDLLLELARRPAMRAAGPKVSAPPPPPAAPSMPPAPAGGQS